MAELHESPMPEQLATGRAEVTAPTDAPVMWDSVAVLWLPDPESRRGWREYYIKRPDPPKPGGRVGFRS